LTSGITLDLDEVSELRFQENLISGKDPACGAALLLDDELLQIALIRVTSANHIPIHIDVPSCVGLQENTIACIEGVSNS
jgi:hypothetical protein